MFQASFKNGNGSGGRGLLWDPKLVFALFSQKSKVRRLVLKSPWWTVLRFVSRRWRSKCIFWGMAGGAFTVLRSEELSAGHLGLWVSGCASCTGGLPKRAFRVLELAWSRALIFHRVGLLGLLWTLDYTRVFTCERRIRRGKKRGRDG